MLHLFKNKKTNNVYFYLFDAIEATNGREGINVAVYNLQSRKTTRSLAEWMNY